MPNPAQYKNTEESYKKYMRDCMHTTLHKEKKKQKNQAIAICLNRWRKEHGHKHPGKPPKKAAMNVVAAFLAASKFPVEPIITDGDKLPGYLWCGDKCKHLSSEGGECYLFRQQLQLAPSKGKYLRCKECVSYVEGLT